MPEKKNSLDIALHARHLSCPAVTGWLGFDVREHSDEIFRSHWASSVWNGGVERLVWKEKCKVIEKQTTNSIYYLVIFYFSQRGRFTFSLSISIFDTNKEQRRVWNKLLLDKKKICPNVNELWSIEIISNLRYCAFEVVKLER